MHLKHFIFIVGLCVNSQAIQANPFSDRLLQQANTWESRDRIDLARKAIDKLFRVQAEHPDGLARLAFYALRENKIPEAQAILQRLIKADPQHPEISNIQLMLRLQGKDKKQLQQAQLLAKAGRTDKAIKVYDNLFPNGFPTAQLAYEYWQLVSKTKNGWARSQAGLQQLTEDYPESLRYRLALIEHKLSHSPGDRKLLNQLFIFLDDPHYQRQASASWRRAIFRLDETASSIPFYKEYLAYDEKDSAIQDLLQKVQNATQKQKKRVSDPAYQAKINGLKQLEANQLSLAETSFKKALKTHQKDYDAIGGMGMIRLRQGKHGQAKSYFQRALVLNPDNAGKWQSLSETAEFWGLLAKANQQENKGHLNQAELSIRQALQVKPQHPDALTRLAQIKAAQGNQKKATTIDKSALKKDNDSGEVLRHLITHQLDSGNYINAKKTLRGLNKQQREAMGSNYARLYSRALRDEADYVQKQGKLNVATKQLELARKYQPQDPWLLYDLARLYNQQGEPEKGHKLFEDALKTKPTSNEMLYAYALFLDSRDNDQKALAMLKRIPEAQRSENVKITGERLQVKIGRSLASRYKDQDNDAAAKATLSKLQEKMQHSPARLLEIVQGWLAIKHDKEALALLNQLNNRSLNQNDSNEVKQQQNRLFINQAEQYRRLGKYEKALKILQNFDTESTQQESVLEEKAALYLAMNKPSLAVNYYQQLRQHNPTDIDLAFDLLDTYIKAGQIEKAKGLARTLSKQVEKKDVSHRLEIIKAWSDMSELDNANQLLTALQHDYPNNPEVLRLAARYAEEDDDKLVLLKAARAAYPQEALNKDLPEIAKLDSDINKLTSKRSGEFNMAYDLTTRSQTDGQSTLTAELIPMEVRFPSIHNGHLFLRIEPVKLDASSLITTDKGDISEFGQGLFCFPTCTAGSAKQKATGTSFAIGYENENLRLDIGTTPLGFLVEDVVGGITYNGDISTFSWGIDISRRPLTSSLLTFAGTKDIHTGKVWGGVRTTGVTFSLSHDDGGPLGFWSNLDLHKITGKNVADNNRTRLMGGAYWKIINNEDKQFSLGLNAGIWRHEKSLDEFTFGQGAYYSPNRYRSLSIPVDFYGRYNDRLSYRFKASVSHSWTFEERTPFYPNDPALQAAAEAAQGVTGINPYFDGGPGGGIGYSFQAAVEYKLNKHLSIGAEAGIERSDFYEPNHFIGYLRYTFEKDHRRVRTPPKPMIPYSNF